MRNENTVVRFHYTPLHGRLPKSGYKGMVLKTIRSVKRHVGSNPTSSFVPQRCAMLERGLLKFLEQVFCSSYFYRKVAQLGRARALGVRCRRFESCLSDAEKVV